MAKSWDRRSQGLFDRLAGATRGWPVRKAIAGLVLLGLVLTAGLNAQQEKRLWVLRQPGEIVEQDPVTFSVQETIQVPSQALKYPENLAINHQGQMLWTPRRRGSWKEPPGPVPQQFWFWDGRMSKAFPKRAMETRTLEGDAVLVTEVHSQGFLSRDGGSLFWFENKVQRRQEARRNLDQSVVTTFRVWQTNLAGEQARKIGEITLPRCELRYGGLLGDLS